MAYTSPIWVALFVVSIIVVLALIGLSAGYVLAQVVNGRHMTIGSAVYWAIYFIHWYYRESLARIPETWTFSILLLYSGILVLFMNIAYAIRKRTLKRNV